MARRRFYKCVHSVHEKLRRCATISRSLLLLLLSHVDALFKYFIPSIMHDKCRSIWKTFWFVYLLSQAAFGKFITEICNLFTWLSKKKKNMRSWKNSWNVWRMKIFSFDPKKGSEFAATLDQEIKITYFDIKSFQNWYKFGSGDEN